MSRYIPISAASAASGARPGRGKARFEEGLGLRRKLAHDNPTSAEAQPNISVSSVKLGEATCDRALLRQALRLVERLDQSGHRGPAPAAHGMIEYITHAIEALP